MRRSLLWIVFFFFPLPSIGTGGEGIAGEKSVLKQELQGRMQLTIEQKGDDPYFDTFVAMLNGREVYRTQAARLGIHKDLGIIEDTNVVLLYEYSGGNVCLATTYVLVGWKSDGFYYVSGRFGNCSGLRISQARNRFIFFFESYKARHSGTFIPSETWIYENGRLRKE